MWTAIYAIKTALTEAAMSVLGKEGRYNPDCAMIQVIYWLPSKEKN